MHSNTLRSRGKPLFGAGIEEVRSETADLREQLNRRLKEKYRNYERAAARLELRGEHDAAQLLRRAAGRMRLLRNQPGNQGGSA